METGVFRAGVWVVSLAISPMALAGPDWTEVGDAGSTVVTAQVPAGTGQLHSLSGRLGGRGVETDYEDMYFVGIDSPTTFHLVVPNADFDAKLYVFNVTLPGGAYGLLGNDNRDIESTVPEIYPMSTDGTEVTLDLPGDYLVCVCGAGRRPVSASGDIFFFETTTEISGADGQGGLNRLLGWEGEGATGDYRVDMQGTVFPSIPAPATMLVLMGGVAWGRRR